MLDKVFFIYNMVIVVFNFKERKMNGYNVYFMKDGKEVMKVGAIVKFPMYEKQYDVLDGLSYKLVTGWNWMCMGAGKQRRGRGNFKNIEDAKKALLKNCRFNKSNLKFVEKVAA
jgi:hypothetical protein